jgi:hypothetical protein
MAPFFRYCVECPKCSTRYLIAFSPYGNGSYLVRSSPGPSEEYLLYCACGRPPVFSRWECSKVKRYSVPKAAYDRGFGTPQEIMLAGCEPRIEIARQSDRDRRELE